MSDRYEDERGVIQDVLGPIDAVTHITTRAGAVRGNHTHHRTVQWTWILSGRMLMAIDRGAGTVLTEHSPGDLVCEEAGFPHAWRALEDTEVLVFTKGPRSGEGYETDTVRLETPLLS